MFFSLIYKYGKGRMVELDKFNKRVKSTKRIDILTISFISFILIVVVVARILYTYGNRKQVIGRNIYNQP